MSKPVSSMQSFYGGRETTAKTTQLGGAYGGQSSLSPGSFGVCPGTAGSQQQRFSQLNQSRSVTPNQLQQQSSSASNFYSFYQSSSGHSPPTSGGHRPMLQGGGTGGVINGLGSPTVGHAYQSAMNRHGSATNYFCHGTSLPMGGSPNRSLPIGIPPTGCYGAPGAARDPTGFPIGKYVEPTGGGYGSIGAMGRFPGGVGQTMFKRMYGNGNATGPTNLNDNEFPCLSMGGHHHHHHHHGHHIYRGPYGSAATAGSRAYNLMGSMKPAAVSAQPEFQMENEDFPALPGSEEPKKETTPAGGGGGGVAIGGATGTLVATNVSGTTTSATTADGTTINNNKSAASVALRPAAAVANKKKTTVAAKVGAEKSGIRLLPDGSLVGLPPSMLRDHFGMAGMVVFLKSAQKDQAMISLLLGHDLMHLGVNLNSSEKYLHPSFGGPWSDGPVSSTEMNWKVPPEYNENATGEGEPKTPIKVNRFNEELLFWLFYYCGGETYQLVAAAELYLRDWRYHKQDKVWLTRAPGTTPVEKTATYERGVYHIFDPITWRKVAKEMLLEYAKLEDQPSNPYASAFCPGGMPMPSML